MQASQVETTQNKSEVKTPVEEQKYETYNYSTNTANVMRILVGSIYTDRDIFIRELISNASDAISKAELLNNKNTLNNEIKISCIKDLNQIIIQDSGIGINKDDLINKIGSIGTSGTKQFMESIAQSKDKMIGQFGVGFYSAYLVSESIKIITKPISEGKTWEWISDSESSYSIRELHNVEDPDFTRGTKIILTLRPDSYEYLEQDRLIEIIKTHSSYINYPILFEKHSTKADSDEVEIVWEKLNWVPIWAKPKEEITEEEYHDFYLNNIKDNLEQHVKELPVIYKHFKIEGDVNFTALLYIPKKAPFNLFEPSKRGQSIKLYTKNVLITADHKDLYPKWMEFVKGIVDTSDIELNVSRQTIQNTRKLRKISNQLVKKVIEMMEELKQDEKTYDEFYREFSCSIKNGINEEFSGDHDYRNSDGSNRIIGNRYGKQMMKLLKFNTSFGRYVGIEDYVKMMKPEQKAIYYIAGDKKEALELSPFMDRLRTLDLEVLYFEEPIDEYIKGFLTEYKMNEWGGDIVGPHDQNFDRFKEPDLTDLMTKTFVDVTRDKLLLSDALMKPTDTDIDEKEGNKLCDRLKNLYESIGISLFKVILDLKFTSVPAIIVNQVHLSAQLEKLLNNSTGTKRNEQYKSAFERKNMLISSSNQITKYLYQKLCVENISFDDSNIIELAHTIYTSALISGGYEPNNPFKFIKTVNQLLLNSLNFSGIEQKVVELDVEEV